MPIKKNIIYSLALLFASILLTFLLLEASARLLAKIPIFDKRMNDIWYIGIPHHIGIFKSDYNEFTAHYRYNSFGFRDYDYPIEKAKDTCRIAVLGDSFAESLQVELNETWHEKLERKLNNEKTGKFEVVNFGSSNSGTATAYFILERYALQLKPDVVLLLFYTRNDAWDNYFELKGKHFVLDENGELKAMSQYEKESYVKKLARESRFLITANRYYLKIKSNFLPKGTLTFDGTFLKNYDDGWNRAWNLTKEILLHMDDLAKNNDAAFIIALANSKEQVDLKRWEKILDEHPALKEKEWDMAKPNKILREFCRQKNITCADSLQIFQKSLKKGENPYFEIDDHWTKEGHTVFSDFLYDNLYKGILSACPGAKKK